MNHMRPIPQKELSSKSHKCEQSYASENRLWTAPFEIKHTGSAARCPNGYASPQNDP